MLAMKCDRCGVFYDQIKAPQYANKEYARMMYTHTNDKGDRVSSQLDLCPACEESLFRWFATDYVKTDFVGQQDNGYVDRIMEMEEETENDSNT